ncbi:MAG: hypothetical protein K2X35_12390 [Bryobacteraceae bacterium]|nr:hypothetical protein [Bryobacteraceae bacterium]
MSTPPSGGEPLPRAPRGHPPPDTLELYCLGRLDDAGSAVVEEHLLICHTCQDQLAELDQFVTSFRAASQPEAQRRAESSAWTWQPILNWALPAVALVAFTAYYSFRPPHMAIPRPEQTIVLESLRGAKLSAKAGADRPLRLLAPAEDMTGTVEGRLVNSTGAEIWRGPGVVEGSRITLRVNTGLDPGRVWLRIFTPGGELRREFALDVEPQ